MIRERSASDARFAPLDPPAVSLKILPSLTSPAVLRSMSTEGLAELAAEMRLAICEQVAQSGGHLAPNLGVVELSIAMHRVFDFSHDRLLFDVGH